MQTIRTPEKEFAFLVTLAETGNITRSAAAIGTSRSVVYEWREAHEHFATAWDRAVRVATLGLEDEARRRAEEGIEKPVWHQGVQCGTVREYSDTLMIFLLKAHDPKYRERSAMELTGKDGAPVEFNDNQAAGKLAALLALAQSRKAAQQSADDEPGSDLV